MARLNPLRKSFAFTSALTFTFLIPASAWILSPHLARADAADRLSEIAMRDREASTETHGVQTVQDSYRRKERTPASFDSRISLQKLGVLNPWGSLDDTIISPPAITRFWTSDTFRATETLSSASISPTFKNSPSEKELLVFAPPTVGVFRFPTPSTK